MSIISKISSFLNPAKTDPSIPPKNKNISPISWLPAEIITYLFPFLDSPKTCLNFERACKNFHAISKDLSLPKFYKHFVLAKFINVELEVELEKKLPALVTAIQNRPYTQEEFSKLALQPTKYRSYVHQLTDLELQITAEEKIRQYFIQCKTLLSEAGISANSKDFGKHCILASKMIQSISSGNPRINAVKIQTTLQTFHKNIFADMIDAFASQSIEKITIDSFKGQVAHLKDCFKNINSVDLEKELRQAIQFKHDSSQLDSIFLEYANPDPSNQKVIAIQTSLTELNPEMDNETLDMAARSKANAMAMFYDELKATVDDGNKVVRYNAMRAITG